MNFLTYLYILLPLAVLDAVWLFSMGGLYKRWLAHLFSPSVVLMPVILFYLLYAFGIMYFVVNPAIKLSTGTLQIFFSGAFLGLVAYAAYDLTNHATMKAWPLQVTVIDMLWGALLTGLVSVVAVVIFNYFK